MVEVLSGFIVSLLVSTLIIYFVTKMFGELEGFWTALLAAFIGSVIYSLSYYFLGSSMFASLIAGISWLIALGTLYGIGWVKAFLIALAIWVISSLVGFVLPTASGPV